MDAEEVRRRINALRAQIDQNDTALHRSAEGQAMQDLLTSTPTSGQQRFLVVDQTPQRTETEEMLRNFTTTMTGLLQRFVEVGRQPKMHTAMVETFEGRVEEDPNRFLTVIHHYVDKLEYTDDVDRISVLRAQLRGEAKRWAESIRNAPITYAAFQDRFMDEFNSPRRLAEAYKELYAKAQGTAQSAEEFISLKQALLSRLRPNMGLETTIEIIISLLKPALASRVVGNRPATMEDLIRTVRRVEGEVAREYSLINAARQAVQQPAAARTPCRWCQEWHPASTCQLNPYRNFNHRARDEEIQQQGNGQRAGAARPPPPNGVYGSNGRNASPPRRRAPMLRNPDWRNPERPQHVQREGALPPPRQE